MTVNCKSGDCSGRPAILVTGASTGIGRLIAEQLLACGCHVFAGARTDSDLAELEAIGMHAVRLDVTRREDIEAAVATVGKERCGLYALVNNAGVAAIGPIISGDDKEFEVVMAVNVFGPYRVTRAFASTILTPGGRIVTIGSISGILADRNVGPYSMSKHALEAFTDSLASELEPAGVHVSLIEPGPFNTRLVENVGKRTQSTLALPDLSKYMVPDDVAKAVKLALFEPKPRRRYLVVCDANDASRTIERQLSKLVELNEGHRFSCDRDTLVRILDEKIGEWRSRYPMTSPAEADRRVTAAS